MPDNFSHAPHWEWLVICYLFVGGLAAGTFVLGTLLSQFGQQQDRPVAKVAFFTSFPLVVACPILLTFHLGEPLRFWHMLINISEGTPTFLKFWSPMPVGAWVLLIFGLCVGLTVLNMLITRPISVSSVATAGGPGFASLGLSGGRRGFMPPLLENIVVATGFVTGLFIMGYTGVLLSASNQPVWSNAWALGGLFAASSLAGSASLLSLVLWLTKTGRPGLLARLGEMLFYFIVLALAMLVVVELSLGSGDHFKGWAEVAHLAALVLELLVALLLVPLVLPVGVRYLTPARRKALLLVAAALVLVGGFLLRTAIVFAPQTI
jgi:formate-dependent nitrite reductase membrane component NrfD